MDFNKDLKKAKYLTPHFKTIRPDKELSNIINF